MTIAYQVLATTEEEYFTFLEIHQGNIPELYRDHAIYYSTDFIDILHPEACYSIPINGNEIGDQKAIAQNFINQLMQSDKMTHAVNGQMALDLH